MYEHSIVVWEAYVNGLSQLDNNPLTEIESGAFANLTSIDLGFAAHVLLVQSFIPSQHDEKWVTDFAKS